MQTASAKNVTVSPDQRPPALVTTGQPPSHGSLGERAYAEIRDRIISLQLPPGTPLNEDQLIAALGVGRTPVREAVKRLALETLVDVYPRRGTFVSEIQITDLAAISEVREQLEGHAAELASRRFIPTEDRLALEDLLRKLEQLDSGSNEATMGLDADVHRFVYRVARNPYLEDALTRLFNLSFRIWNLALSRLNDVRWSVGEHVQLLEAIRASDSDLARLTASRHVAEFEREMRAVL